jgi:hypothetical protein
MLAAMHEQPGEFSFSSGWLKHHPSHHRFKVQGDGYVIVDAECGCAGLAVRAEQGRQLVEALQCWRVEYWVPREINRHFARHFRTTSLWRRWLRKVAALWSRERSDSALAIYAQAWADCGQIGPGNDSRPRPPYAAKPDVPPPRGSFSNARRESEEATV